MSERLHARLAACRPRSTRDRATALFFGVLVMYLLTGAYTAQSIDTISAYEPAWQFAHHGNVTMTDDSLWVVRVGDRLVPARFPGVSWLATPLYLFDRSPVPTSGMSVLTAAAASAGATVVLVLLCLRLGAARHAWSAGLILAFATPTWTVSGDALWTHGPGQLWLLLGVLLSATSRPLAAGLAFGAALVTRPHYALVAAALAVAAAVRRRYRAAVLLCAGTSVGLCLLVLYNHVVLRRWGVSSGYPGTLTDPAGVGPLSFVENIAGTLVSPSRGVLVLTPFLLPLLPGLRAAWQQAPGWVRAAAVGGTAYMLVQLWLNRFSGGYAFYSYRLPLEWLTMCAPLLLLSYRAWTERRRSRRRVFAVLVGFSVVTHALGAALFRPERSEPSYWTTWPPGEVVASRPVASAAIVLVVGAMLAAAAWRARSAADAAGVPLPARSL